MGLVLWLLGVIGISVVVFFFTALIEAWAVSVLWGWFVVPFFHLPHLGYAEAFGLITLFALVNDRAGKMEDDNTTLAIRAAFNPAIAVALGWIAKTIAGI